MARNILNGLAGRKLVTDEEISRDKFCLLLLKIRKVTIKKGISVAYNDRYDYYFSNRSPLDVIELFNKEYNYLESNEYLKINHQVFKKEKSSKTVEKHYFEVKEYTMALKCGDDEVIHDNNKDLTLEYLLEINKNKG